MQQLSQSQINIITHQQPRIFNPNGIWCVQKTITPHLVITGEGKTMEEAAISFAKKVFDHHTSSEYDRPFDDETMD